jgi:molecular chaperone GrpE (heat shock protein)
MIRFLRKFWWCLTRKVGGTKREHEEMRKLVRSQVHSMRNEAAKVGWAALKAEKSAHEIANIARRTIEKIEAARDDANAKSHFS